MIFNESFDSIVYTLNALTPRNNSSWYRVVKIERLDISSKILLWKTHRKPNSSTESKRLKVNFYSYLMTESFFFIVCNVNVIVLIALILVNIVPGWDIEGHELASVHRYPYEGQYSPISMQ